MLTKKHLVGVAASALLFGMFGMFIGFFAIAIGGVQYTDPFSTLATGPTPITATEVFGQLGLTPDVVGLSQDDVLVLPAIPATISIGGLTIDLANYSVAEVFGYGGAAVGILIGFYYAFRIAYEQRQDTGQGDNAVASDE